MPGPGKSELVKSKLLELWDGACEAIQNSAAILFLGYRFPPSDAMARERLLEALRKNQKPFLDLHVVLGPNLNNPDVLRMQGLLDATMRQRHTLGETPLQYSLTLHPLFVEDFAATWKQMLLQLP